MSIAHTVLIKVRMTGFAGCLHHERGDSGTPSVLRAADAGDKAETVAPGVVGWWKGR